MPKNLLRMVFAGVLLSLLVSCSVLPSRTVVLTEKDSGKTIDLRTGDYLEIHLEANPTTGYLWSSSTPNDYILRLLLDEYAGKKQDRQLVGAPVRKIFRYGAVGPGKTGIRLEYRRPWEKNQPPAGTFDVMVIVSGESTFREPEETDGPVRMVGSKGNVEYRYKGSR